MTVGRKRSKGAYYPFGNQNSRRQYNITVVFYPKKGHYSWNCDIVNQLFVAEKHKYLPGNSSYKNKIAGDKFHLYLTNSLLNKNIITVALSTIPEK